MKNGGGGQGRRKKREREKTRMGEKPCIATANHMPALKEIQREEREGEGWRAAQNPCLLLLCYWWWWYLSVKPHGQKFSSSDKEECRADIPHATGIRGREDQFGIRSSPRHLGFGVQTMVKTQRD